MIRWSIAKHLRRLGITKPYQLHAATGISQPAAKRIMAGEELDKIDVPTLMALHRTFKLRGAPWSLLAYAPDAPPPHPSGQPAPKKRPRK